MIPDVVDRLRGEIEARLRILAPVVREAERLGMALRRLRGVPDGRPRRQAPPAEPRQGAQPRSRASGSPRPRAPRGQNRRAILDLVAQRPGVLPREIARVTGIDSRTVSATLYKLSVEGAVRHLEEGGWAPPGTPVG